VLEEYLRWPQSMVYLQLAMVLYETSHNFEYIALSSVAAKSRSHQLNPGVTLDVT
jgi:hypothetical protein